jgi:hypothetical protein
MNWAEKEWCDDELQISMSPQWRRKRRGSLHGDHAPTELSDKHSPQGRIIPCGPFFRHLTVADDDLTLVHYLVLIDLSISIITFPQSYYTPSMTVGIPRITYYSRGCLQPHEGFPCILLWNRFFPCLYGFQKALNDMVC